jgi:hypothetical protein
MTDCKHYDTCWIRRLQSVFCKPGEDEYCKDCKAKEEQKEDK